MQVLIQIEIKSNFQSMANIDPVAPPTFSVFNLCPPPPHCQNNKQTMQLKFQEKHDGKVWPKISLQICDEGF